MLAHKHITVLIRKHGGKAQILADAQKEAERHLTEDRTEHIASIVAGENRIYIDSGIFPTEEEVRGKYGS